MPERILKEKNGARWVLSDADDPARDVLHEQIKVFNNARSLHHRAARSGTGAPQPLNVFVYDAVGELVAGVSADTYWGWLNIDNLWVVETLRGEGLGRELILNIENAARERGCTCAKLETFSFQARGFYEKLGYEVAGELQNYPPGGAFYWMKKDLG